MALFTIENLLYLGANLFRIYVMYRFANAFLEKKNTNWSELIAYALYFVINSAAYLLITNNLINLITNMVPFLAITFLYKSRVYKKILIVVSIYAVSLFWDAILYAVFINFDIDNIIISTGVATALMIFITELIFERFSKFKGDLILSISHLIAIVFIPLGSIVIGAFTMTEPSVVAIISAFILLAINVTVFYLYDSLGQAYEEKHEKLLLEQQNKAYINQLEVVSESQTTLRFFKHDMDNHFMKMKDLLIDKDYDNLSNYLNDCSDYTKPEYQYSNSGNHGIDSVLNYKLKEISEKGTKIDVRINLTNKLYIGFFDLIVILGNLVDNAIDELKKSDGGLLAIEIKHKKGIVFIKIENTCHSEPNLKNGCLLTSKPDAANHGLGLQSVKRTLDKYKGKMTISFENNIFSVNALLYNGNINRFNPS